MTVSRHAQYQDPETEAAKWNSAISDFIIYACAFTTNIYVETLENLAIGEHCLILGLSGGHSADVLLSYRSKIKWFLNKSKLFIF